MSSINYIRLCEIQRVEKLTFASSEDEFPAYLRKRSEERIQQDRIQQRYESRRNICDRCYVAVSTSGSCNC